MKSCLRYSDQVASTALLFLRFPVQYLPSVETFRIHAIPVKYRGSANFHHMRPGKETERRHKSYFKKRYKQQKKLQIRSRKMKRVIWATPLTFSPSRKSALEILIVPSPSNSWKTSIIFSSFPMMDCLMYFSGSFLLAVDRPITLRSGLIPLTSVNVLSKASSRYRPCERKMCLTFIDPRTVEDRPCQPRTTNSRGTLHLESYLCKLSVWLEN